MGADELPIDESDPIARKIELAEEFRQIGDVEGARDVLQELIAQVSSGPVYEKAKALLDELR
jgi:pilus assembly protein FimV